MQNRPSTTVGVDSESRPDHSASTAVLPVELASLHASPWPLCSPLGPNHERRLSVISGDTKRHLVQKSPKSLTANTGSSPFAGPWSILHQAYANSHSAKQGIETVLIGASLTTQPDTRA